MARITRKELKTDNFALEVEHTAVFFEEHRQEIIRYGGAAAVVILLILGYFWYSRNQHAAREQALSQAIQVQEAPVGANPNGGTSFPTQEAKDQETVKVFTALHNKYAGSTEGEIAEYYLGSIQSDQGKLAEAEKSFQSVVQKGDEKYASLAKLSLAQIYFADGRTSQGEAMLRDLMAHPTLFVSKEQAQIMLARYLLKSNPTEARKLLDPLRTQGGSVGQVALSLYGELPTQ
ncbi:MAG TPA: tetratricopeptide repeat protein [Candidatus Sulfopaludibacter sp.]|nr:tetratricopeptide repeat protein [Candidatus Sulfopaludibacter sp.]